MSSKTPAISDHQERCETLIEIGHAIGLPQTAVQYVLDYPLSDAMMADYRDLFALGDRPFFDRMHAEGGPSHYFPVYLRLAADSLHDYGHRDISQSIYIATFSDLAYWHHEYWSLTGNHGIAEHNWTTRHLRLRLFRLGRLQFQPISMVHAIDGGPTHVDKGDLVLSIHITPGEPLSPEACDFSFDSAIRFFHGVDPVFYAGSTWLLDEHISQMLPKKSNIALFRQRFHCVPTLACSHQAEERVFGFVSDDPSVYPASSLLQSKFRSYLLAGKTVGEAEGIFRWKK